MSDEATGGDAPFFTVPLAAASGAVQCVWPAALAAAGDAPTQAIRPVSRRVFVWLSSRGGSQPFFGAGHGISLDAGGINRSISQYCYSYTKPVDTAEPVFNSLISLSLSVCLARSLSGGGAVSVPACLSG